MPHSPECGYISCFLARIKQRSPGWARTNDLVINSHALFRLSYQRFDLSRRSDLNGRPPYYKYGALPLSYSGFCECRYV